MKLIILSLCGYRWQYFVRSYNGLPRDFDQVPHHQIAPLQRPSILWASAVVCSTNNSNQVLKHLDALYYYSLYFNIATCTISRICQNSRRDRHLTGMSKAYDCRTLYSASWVRAYILVSLPQSSDATVSKRHVTWLSCFGDQSFWIMSGQKQRTIRMEYPARFWVEGLIVWQNISGCRKMRMQSHTICAG